MYLMPLCLSAFLLFLFQPLMAQAILPWFGGGASIWMVCTLFFQIMLLCGYLYADGITQLFYRFPRITQFLHGLVVLIALSVTYHNTIIPSLDGVSINASPVREMFLVLLSKAAVPFFILSSTSSLVQMWMAYDKPHDSSYRLYAWSNASSLLALFAYPFLLEPFFDVPTLQWFWMAGFVLYSIVILIVTLKPRIENCHRFEANTVSARENKPSLKQMLFWGLMSLSSSLFLSAMTYHLTQDVAPMPLLWVCPLAIYLLSFIVAFAYPNAYRFSRWELRWMAICMLYFAVLGSQLSLSLWFCLSALLLFVVCYVLHAECVSRAPISYYSSRFYLILSLGGVLGACLGVLVVPVTLGLSYFFPCALLFVFIVLGLRGCYLRLQAKGFSWQSGWQEWGAFLGLVVILIGFQLLRESVEQNGIKHSKSYHDFYGTSVVERYEASGRPPLQRLMHGTTLHGVQVYAPEWEDMPIGYYSHPILAQLLKSRSRSMHWAVVGLGAGGLASYARKDDYVRFYELNSTIERIAEQDFTYLSRARKRGAHVDIVLGDGRLMLSRAVHEPLLDVLVLDAFSSDSIPTHLLTHEAMKMYQQRLRQDGVLIIHISHRYLNLKPLLVRLSAEMGWSAIGISAKESALSRTHTKLMYSYPSEWVLLSANQLVLDQVRKNVVGAEVLHSSSFMPLWTDQHHSFHCLWKDYPCKP